MKKTDIVQAILGGRWKQAPLNQSGKAFAPTNIALCKYWGKRNQELNLPMTSSLSISLGAKGATTEFIVNDKQSDTVFLNQTEILPKTNFFQKLLAYLNLFRDASGPFFNIHIETNIPIAAGLASSACGFAALIQALNNLYGWKLSSRQLSILARIGSGSASRSVYQGFVEWHAGENSDGMDSFAEPISTDWPTLRIGLLIMNESEKEISSRDAMQMTVTTSELYAAWPQKVKKDLHTLKQAIAHQDFISLGETAESNALAMHATMLAAWPPITYCLPDTLGAMKKVWQLRKEGLPLFFTQDAGPNLKLLFLEKNTDEIKKCFPEMEVVKLF